MHSSLLFMVTFALFAISKAEDQSDQATSLVSTTKDTVITQQTTKSLSDYFPLQPKHLTPITAFTESHNNNPNNEWRLSSRNKRHSGRKITR